MTALQLQRLLNSAGLSQRGAAREIAISERQMRRYIASEAPIPKSVELAVRHIAQVQKRASSCQCGECNACLMSARLSDLDALGEALKLLKAVRMPPCVDDPIVWAGVDADWFERRDALLRATS